MNYKSELDAIEKKVENNKLEQARLQERKKKLLEDKQEILNQLKEEKIEIDDLENTVLNLEVEIQESITKCQQIIN